MARSKKTWFLAIAIVAVMGVWGNALAGTPVAVWGGDSSGSILLLMDFDGFSASEISQLQAVIGSTITDLGSSDFQALVLGPADFGGVNGAQANSVLLQIYPQLPNTIAFLYIQLSKAGGTYDVKTYLSTPLVNYQNTFVFGLQIPVKIVEDASGLAISLF